MATQTAKSKLPNLQAPQPEERYKIHGLLKAKQAISEIARSLGRSHSNISREHSRRRDHRGYGAEHACDEASLNEQRAAVMPAVLTPKSGSMQISTWAFNGNQSRLKAK
jgi:IS30 family transposase